VIFWRFWAARVNCDEMDGDRPRLPANRNCYRLSRVSWALSQISCLFFRQVATFRQTASNFWQSCVLKILRLHLNSPPQNGKLLPPIVLLFPCLFLVYFLFISCLSNTVNKDVCVKNDYSEKLKFSGKGGNCLMLLGILIMIARDVGEPV